MKHVPLLVSALFVGVFLLFNNTHEKVEGVTSSLVPSYSCTTSENVPVQFYTASTQYINKQLKAALGAAVTDHAGNPLVFLDENGLAKLTVHHKIFLIEHECAHHELGHTKYQPQQFYNIPDGIKNLEKDADCYAIKKLKNKYKFTHTDFAFLFKDYYRVDVLRQIGIFGGDPDVTNKELSDYGQTRVLAMQTCLMNLK